MKREISAVALCAMLLGLCVSARGATAGKNSAHRLPDGESRHRGESRSDQHAFRQRLKELGYIEGKNIAIEFRLTGAKGQPSKAIGTRVGPAQCRCSARQRLSSDSRGQRSD